MGEKTYLARVKFADIREVCVKANSYEEALEKYNVGEWEYEDTVDFYSEEELKALEEVPNH